MNGLENILLVHNYYQISGGEDTVVTNEKKLLEDKGHKVLVYNRSNSEIKKFSILKKLLLPIIMIFNVRTYKDIRRIIEREQIDIVHVHNTLALVSPSVYYAALSKAVPVIQTVHNFRLLCPGATFYRNGHICEDCIHFGLLCAVKHGCYRGSRLATISCVIGTWIHRFFGVYKKLNYICLTEFNKTMLLELKQIQPVQIFVKPNFADSPYERIIPYKQRKKRFIFAGRIDKLKGIAVLFDAWRKIGREGPELIVCGTGAMKDWCEEYINKHNLFNIKLLGYIPNDEIKKLLADSYALILPTQWYEGFPMTIVEAYSVGTPVIGSDIGNVGSIIDEGVTGWKFKSDSSESLVETVRAVKDISSTVQRAYIRMYTSEINYIMLKSIYKKVKHRFLL